MDRQPQPFQFYYRNVQLLKTECLGTGSYGTVYKAMCDLLPCAAKLLHPVLFQSSDPGAQSPRRRFEQECHFLSAMKHPHIVQYLGTTQDPESGLPVLLMELLDESLTHFLERSQQPLPYHVEVNLCHDIALALAYLHSNDIIHRDLSSNNVLLFAGSRAKVTDFGMSKIISHTTTFTMCPGTSPYMPPEALSNCPVYSKKIDCFSFGVLEIQIMTCQFPDPGPATQMVKDSRSPTGTTNMPILENERRRSHIVLIDPAHPLLPVALHCIKYSELERPSAEDICQQLATLKESLSYAQSVQQSQETADTERQLRELQEQNQQLYRQAYSLQKELETHNKQLREKDDILEASELEKMQLLQAGRNKQDVFEAKERELHQLNKQLEADEQVIAQFQRNHVQHEETIRELQETITQLRQKLDRTKHVDEGQHANEAIESHLQLPDQALQATTQDTVHVQYHCHPQQRKTICLKWNKSVKAPERMCRGAATLHDTMAYFNSYNSTAVHAYNSENEQWSTLPDCPYKDSSLVIAEGMLTAVGGDVRGKATNSLHSLTGKGRRRKWVEHFPLMPTKRYWLAAVCKGRNLIAAGGWDGGRRLTTVEVLDTESFQWSIATSLPHVLYCATAVICEDQLYLLGGLDQKGQWTLSVLMCSLPDLLQQQLQYQQVQTSALALADPLSVWHQAANMPHYNCTCVSLCGRVVAIGGQTTTYKDTSAVVTYNPTLDYWQPMRDMPTARCQPLVVVLPADRLMVVGGMAGRYTSDKVEIANIL